MHAQFCTFSRFPRRKIKKKYGAIRLIKDFQTRNGARGYGELSEAIANDGVH